MTFTAELIMVLHSCRVSIEGAVHSYAHLEGLERKWDQSYEGVGTVKEVLLAQLIQCAQHQGTKQDV